MARLTVSDDNAYLVQEGRVASEEKQRLRGGEPRRPDELDLPLQGQEIVVHLSSPHQLYSRLVLELRHAP